MADENAKGSLVVTMAMTAAVMTAAIALYGCLGPVAGYLLLWATGIGLFAGVHWLLWGRTMPCEPPEESERG